MWWVRTLESTMENVSDSLYNVESQMTLFWYSYAAWTLGYLLIGIFLSKWSLTCNSTYLYRVQITESLISSIQGILCGAAGVVVVLNCKHDVMKARHPLAVTYSSIGSAYFIYDLLAMFYSHGLGLNEKQKQAGFKARMKLYLKANWLMIAHHVILICLLFPALVYYSNMGDFFTGAFYLTEISTPFVNARIIISKLGFKESKLYVINGVLMMLVFGVFRVYLFPGIYWQYISQQKGEVLQILSRIPVQCHIYCLILLTPQLYWWSLMLRGIYHVVIKKVSSPVDKID